MFIKNIIIFLLFTPVIYCQSIVDGDQSFQKKFFREIIFWGPSPAEADSMNDDDKEAYSDYYYYMSKSSSILKELGIEVKDTTSFQIEINYDNDKSEIYKRKPGSIGYILNDGKQKPEVIRYVMTDIDIISKAKEFFQIK
jgi:hypothetical protein